MNRLLQNLASAQAEIRPEATALVMGSDSMTYGQLEMTSNRLARLLSDDGCRPGDRVCLFQKKSPRAILAMLSVLKAGGIYVPIDLESPPARAAMMTRTCEAQSVLVDQDGARLFDQMVAHEEIGPPPRVVAMEMETLEGEAFRSHRNLGDLDSIDATAPSIQISDSAPAHILFTSGSTGTPKGVAVTHGNVLAFVEWAVDHFGMAPGDGVSGHAPLHFDLSTFDIYGTLAAGCELHLVPSELNLLPHKLAAFIRTSEVVQWFSVPSVLTFMAKFDVIASGDFPRLKRLLWCGEVLPVPILIHWMKRLPHVSFTNLYGPTETTIASSYHTVPACPEDDESAIPIGTACRGEQLLVLDDDLRPVPTGAVGHLFIRGTGVTPGYWNDPGKTREVFLSYEGDEHPQSRVYRTGDLARVGEDGLVYFLGREDAQIKSRGHRIELGEIESALNTMACLSECAALGVGTDGFEGKVICCAYVPSASHVVTPVELRQELAKVLPRYMIPTRWRAYESLPKTSNGKTNRRVLREEFEKDAATSSRD